MNETKSPLLIHPHVSIALGGKFIFGHFSRSVGFADINIHRGVFRTLSNGYDGNLINWQITINEIINRSFCFMEKLC